MATGAGRSLGATDAESHLDLPDVSRRVGRPARAGVHRGSTVLHYDLRIVDDMHAMLVEHGDWMPLGNADEQKPAPEGSVEAWARSADNPIGGWYGLKKGLRGRVGNYVSPVLEVMGLAELEHNLQQPDPSAEEDSPQIGRASR